MSPNERLEIIATLKALEYSLADGERATAERILIDMITRLKIDQENHDRQMEEQLEAWRQAGDAMMSETARRALSLSAPMMWKL